jgi:hypothetical protein
MPTIGGWRADPGSVCVAIVDYGWPLRSVRGHDFAVNDPRVLLNSNPSVWHQNMDVLWPGFAINTIFYAAILWLPFAALGRFRRRRRIKRGLCPKCAYDLRGNPHPGALPSPAEGQGMLRCPECGTAATLLHSAPIDS